MTDEESTDAAGGLGAEERAEYAELLAAYLPPTERVPDDVVDRLERALDDLVAERRGDPSGTSVPPGDLARAAGRRRRLGGALLAAAAVTVGGFAVAPTLTGAGGDDSESAVAAQDSDGAGGALDEAREEARGEAVAPAAEALPRVRTDRVDEDVIRLVEQEEVTSLTAADGQFTDGRFSEKEADGRTTGELRADRSAGGCEIPSLDSGETWFLVRYAGATALVVAEPEDAPPPRIARLLPCVAGAAPVLVRLPQANAGR